MSASKKSQRSRPLKATSKSFRTSLKKLENAELAGRVQSDRAAQRIREIIQLIVEQEDGKRVGIGWKTAIKQYSDLAELTNESSFKRYKRESKANGGDTSSFQIGVGRKPQVTPADIRKAGVAIQGGNLNRDGLKKSEAAKLMADGKNISQKAMKLAFDKLEDNGFYFRKPDTSTAAQYWEGQDVRNPCVHAAVYGQALMYHDQEIPTSLRFCFDFTGVGVDKDAEAEPVGHYDDAPEKASSKGKAYALPIGLKLASAANSIGQSMEQVYAFSHPALREDECIEVTIPHLGADGRDVHIILAGGSIGGEHVVYLVLKKHFLPFIRSVRTARAVSVDQPCLIGLDGDPGQMNALDRLMDEINALPARVSII
jgi:hypothetical protein